MIQEKIDRLQYILEALADIGETISGSQTIGKASKEILHIVMGAVGVSKGALLILQGKYLTVCAARGTQIGKICILSDKLLNELNSTETKLLLRWCDEFPEQLKKICNDNFRELETVSAIILRAQSRIIGLLLLSKRYMEQNYQSEDLKILASICKHVSVALYNFSLRSETQKANFRLSQKVLQLESMQDLSLSIASFKPKTEMLREVINGAVSLIDAEIAFILEIEGDKLAASERIGIEKDLQSLFAASNYPDKILSGHILRFRSSKKIKSILGTGSLLAVPILTSQKKFGIIVVAGKESKDSRPEFSEDDEKLLKAFAAQAAVSLENMEMQKVMIEQERLKYELETASAIQQLIVPKPEELPQIEGCEIYGYNYPSKEVGGDYFDIIQITDKKWGLIICDVSGKGLPAALLVSTLQATFHALFKVDMGLTEIADRANKLLFNNTTPDKYSTGFIGIIDIDKGIIETVNAGHNQPLLLRNSGEVRKLGIGGVCFGMFDYSTYHSQISQLYPGDTLYLFTDGVSEAFTPDGEEFDDERLEELVKSLKAKNPKDMLMDIEHTIRDWTQQFKEGEGFSHDDFTHMAIKYSGL